MVETTTVPEKKKLMGVLGAVETEGIGVMCEHGPFFSLTAVISAMDLFTTLSVCLRSQLFRSV